MTQEMTQLNYITELFFFFSIGNENDLLPSEKRHLAYCKNERAHPLLFVSLVDEGPKSGFITVQSTVWIKSKFTFIC